MAPITNRANIQPCRVAPRPVKEAATWASSTTTSTEAILEQLAIMRRFESTSYQAKNYYRDNSDDDDHSKTSRCLTVEYLYQVVDYGGFQRDVVTYAMTHLMDRYLASIASEDEKIMDRNHSQLIALTCLYMAVKLLEPNNIGIDSLVPLTNHVYTVQHFVAMESHILSTLQWRVAQGPTPLMFVQHLLLLLPQSQQQSSRRHSKLASALYPHIQYQLELAVSNADLSLNHTPSDVGIAAIWNALEAIDVSVFSLETKERYQRVVQQALGRELWDEPGKLMHLQTTLRQLMVAAYNWSTTANTSPSSGTAHTPDKTTSERSSEGRTSVTTNKTTSTKEDEKDSSSSPQQVSKDEPASTSTPTTTTKSQRRICSTSSNSSSSSNHSRQEEQPRPLNEKRTSRSDQSINDVSDVDWFLHNA